MNLERGYLLRLVHRQILEHDGDALEQSRAALAAVGYLFLAAGAPARVRGPEIPRIDDVTADLLCLLGDGLIVEATADLPPVEEAA